MSLDLFEEEEKILLGSQTLLEEEKADTFVLRKGLSDLTMAYSTLLKQSRQLIRMGDRREADMAKMNKTLEDLARRLEEQAKRDTLTGALNKGAITHFITRTLESTALSLMMFDLDHFKRVNDTYGHPIGDRLLAALSRLVREFLPRYAHFGRFGGEEFLIALPETSLSKAAHIAETLRQQVEQACFCEELPELRLTISLGVAFCPAQEPFMAAYHRMDQALYHAKHTGRNRVCLAESSPLYLSTLLEGHFNESLKENCQTCA